MLKNMEEERKVCLLWTQSYWWARSFYRFIFIYVFYSISTPLIPTMGSDNCTSKNPRWNSSFTACQEKGSFTLVHNGLIGLVQKVS